MDALYQIEVAVNLFLQGLGSALTLPMQIFSFLGQEEVLLLFLPVLYWCIAPGFAFRLLGMIVATNSLNAWLKVIFAAPRPFWIDKRVVALATDPYFGSPSGHAQNAAALWGLAAWGVARRWFTILASGVIFLIGLSRIYLGMHFPSQVILGWVVGLVLLWLFIRLEKPVLNWVKKQSLWMVELAIVGSVLVLLAVTFLVLGVWGDRPLSPDWVANASATAPGNVPIPYDPSILFTSAGVWLGTAGGAAWFNRTKGMFKAGGTPLQRVFRWLLGMAGVMILYAGLGAIFPRSADWIGYSLRFIRYALIGGWISALAPLVFLRLKLAAR